MNQKAVQLFFLSSMISITCLTGCVTALIAGGAAATAVTYINGELRSSLDHPITPVWDATIETTHELQLEIVEQTKDGLNARLHAKGATDKDIYINLKSITQDVTQVRIRIDVFGDETMSRQIFRSIEENLKKR